MALLALQAISTKYSVGLFVAGKAGVFFMNMAAFAIDAKFVYPALFKQEPTEGPRYNDIGVSQTSIGAPAARAYGEKVRVAGWTFWQTKLRESKDTTSGGKGPGTGGDYVVYKYFKHCAVEILRTYRNTPIYSVDEILADGKTFWTAQPDINYSSTAISAERTTLLEGTSNAYDVLKIISDHSLGGPDLSKIQSGRDVTVGGFTNGGTILSGLTRVAATQNPASTYPYGVPSRSSGSKFMSMEAQMTGGLFAGDTFTITGVSGTYRVIAAPRIQFNGSPSGPVYDRQDVYFTPALTSTAAANAAIAITKNATPNNGTFYCFSSQLDEPANKSYIQVRLKLKGTYSFGGSDVGDTITVFQEQPQFSKSQVEEVSIYYGSRDQIPDPLISSVEAVTVGGEANIPAFGKRSYFVAKNLELTDYGNRMPNWEIIARPAADFTLRSELRRMLLDVGRPEGSFDVSGIPDSLLLGGMVVRGPTPLKSTLQPLTIVYDLMFQELSSGVLKFFTRQNATVIDIPLADLGYRELGGKAPYPLEVQELGNISAVQEVVVKFYDPTLKYMPNAARDRFNEEISGEVSEVDTQLVMSKDQAQQIAAKLLAQSNLGRNSVRLQLSPKYLGVVRENTVLRIPTTRPWNLLTTKIDTRNDYLLEVEGLEEDAEILNQTTTAEGTLAATYAGGGRQPRAISFAPPIEAMVLDLPMIHDQYADVPGYWVVGAIRDRDLPFRGYTVYESFEQESGYKARHIFKDEAVIGIVGVIPESSINRHMIDGTRFVEVTLLGSWTLESIPESEMLAGHNRFLIGDEIIGAANVELIGVDEVTGAYTYRLSGLIGGLLGTGGTTHVIGERFVWLDGPGVNFLPISATRVGEPHFIKAVGGGAFLDDAEPISVTPSGLNVKPLAPTQIKATRDGSNNATITFERSLKRIMKVLEDAAPLDEESEGYIIRFYNSTYTTLKRTATVTSRSYSYSAANQLTDGTTPGNTIYVGIAQISKFFHEGPEARVAL